MTLGLQRGFMVSSTLRCFDLTESRGFALILTVLNKPFLKLLSPRFEGNIIALKTLQMTKSDLRQSIRKRQFQKHTELRIQFDQMLRKTTQA